MKYKVITTKEKNAQKRINENVWNQTMKKVCQVIILLFHSLSDTIQIPKSCMKGVVEGNVTQSIFI